jgi:hypothetical protein
MNWILCSEQLPTPYEFVLCKGKRGGKFIAYTKETIPSEDVMFILQEHCGTRRPVYWMPLPE